MNHREKIKQHERDWIHHLVLSGGAVVGCGMWLAHGGTTDCEPVEVDMLDIDGQPIKYLVGCDIPAAVHPMIDAGTLQLWDDPDMDASTAVDWYVYTALDAEELDEEWEPPVRPDWTFEIRRFDPREMAWVVVYEWDPDAA